MSSIYSAIYTKYKAQYSQSPDSAIAFYHENRLLFSNITSFKNAEDLLLFMDVYNPCVSAFVVRKQYKNAIEALKIWPLIENAIDGFKVDRATYPAYKDVLFQKAVSLYNLKDFNAALKLFKLLQGYEPENDLFKNWIKYCRLWKLNKLLYLPLIVALAAMLLQVFLKGPQYAVLHRILSVVVYASVVMGVGLVIYIRSSSNKASA